jgi:phosphatidylglycerol:prolipoprotein diacylglycerol transferase
MVVGGLLGFYLILRLANKYQLDKKLFDDLFLYFVIGAVIGARVYYVVYAWEFYRDNWLDVFKIWEGGLAIHGIMIGGFMATWIFCRIKKQNFLLFADILVVGLALAQVIGRVGNYFNQEIFGLPTSLAWGIPISAVNRPPEFISSQYFHPTFLYESIGSLIIVSVLLFLSSKRFRTDNQRPGNMFFLYLMFYSIMRFGLEFLRTDYSPLVFGIRWAQIFSVLIVLAVVFVLVYRKFKKVE